MFNDTPVQVFDNSGFNPSNNETTVTLRKNSVAENTQLQGYLDHIFSNTEAAWFLGGIALFVPTKRTGIYIRAIPTNSEATAQQIADYNAIWGANAASSLDQNDPLYSNEGLQLIAPGVISGTDKGVAGPLDRGGGVGSDDVTSWSSGPLVAGKYTISINLKKHATVYDINGGKLVLPYERALLHELIHARLDSDPNFLPADAPMNEEITVFLESYLSSKLGLGSERITHFGYDPNFPIGPSVSTMDYLKDSTFARMNITAAHDVSLGFDLNDGGTITKSYKIGKVPGTGGNTLAQSGGADTVEIYYTGARTWFGFGGVGEISEARAKSILKDSAVANSDAIANVKSQIKAFNEATGSSRAEYAPQALLTLGADRIGDGDDAGSFQLEGPRQDASGFVNLQAPVGWVLDTLVVGASGWLGSSSASEETRTSRDKLIGGPGNDILISYSTTDGNELYGGVGSDTLFGSDHRDKLVGGDGNDNLSGGDGVDNLDGGAGDDYLVGGAGDDVLNGGANDDVLFGGAGIDTMDGGTGADALVVDTGDIVAEGEVEDSLFAKTYNTSWFWSTQLTGGERFVQVNDSQTYAQQLQAMRNSTDDFKGSLGETYHVTGSGATQGLKITLKDGSIIQLNKWQEGEYGIHLETTRQRVFDYTPFPFAGGGIIPGIALGAATILFDTFKFVISMSFDPLYSAFGSDRFTLTRLDELLGSPVIPPLTNTINGTGSGEEIHGRIGDDRILAGGGDDKILGFGGSDTLVAGDGNDTIDAGDGADVIDGGAGDDVITGATGNDDITTGQGNDVVIFGAGDGIDTVHADIHDTIRIDQSISSGSTEIARRTAASGGYGDAASGDVVVASGEDKIILVGGAFSRVEFADGTVRTAAELSRESLAANETSGADIIVGSALSETLSGKAGDDYLNGGGGNDRYQFARGDGHDRIEDNDPSNALSLNDSLVFAAGILPSDITVSTSTISDGPRVGAALIRLAIAGTDDWVEFPLTDLEHVRFQDGTVWDSYALSSLALQSLATSGADHIVVTGYDLAGEVRPGAGNDTIDVGAYGATVDFGIGSGTDRVNISNTGQQPGYATIKLDAGLRLSDLRFDRLVDGYSATIISTGESIEYRNQFDGNEIPNILGGSFVVGGEVIDSKLLAKLSSLDFYATAQQTGTASGDTLSGTSGGDRINGAAGNDTIAGNDGNDLLFGGDGNDVITGGNGNDLIIGEAGNDQIDGGAGDDVLRGGAGTDSLSGGAGDDDLTGSGSSTLKGDAGADRIEISRGDNVVYNIGDGSDTIVSAPVASSSVFDGSETLKRSEITLGTGISASTTTLQLEGWSIVIAVNGSATDQIRLERVLQSGQLPEIHFADGTVWRETEIYERLFSPDNGNDTPAAVESVEPEFNNNVIAYIYGGGGNDALNYSFASERRFVFEPGGGNDTVNADGHIILNGFDADTLRIGRSGSGMGDLTISFNGSTDTLTVPGEFIYNPGVSHIADVEIDGATLYGTDLRSLYLKQHETSGNDIVYGFDGPGGYYNGGLFQPAYYPNQGNDTLAGGLGNDLLAGGTGDDTYIFNAGDGQDEIRDVGLQFGEDGGEDLLRLSVLPAAVSFERGGSSGNDLIIHFAASTDQVTIDSFFGNGRIEEIEFADGSLMLADEVAALAIAGSKTAGADTIRGTGDPDTLDGGAGADTLDGGAGPDRYLFALGSGADTIDDSGSDTSNAIGFGAGIAAAALTFERSGDDLLIHVNGSDSLTVLRQFSSSLPVVATFAYADGQVQSWNEVQQLIFDGMATSGADTIDGSVGADTLHGAGGNDNLSGEAGADDLVGGTGNDLLQGGTGADIYQIARGDGTDRIESGDSGSALDSIVFDASIGSRDISFSRPAASDDLLITVQGTSQQITVADYFSSGAIADVRFADGTIFTSTEIAEAIADAAPTANGASLRLELTEGGHNNAILPDGLFSDDGGAEALTYRATLADGSPLPSWLTFEGTGFEAVADDAQVGSWALILTAIDAYGRTVQQAITLDVVDQAEAPIAGAVLSTATATVGAAFSQSIGATLFSDQDSTYRATPIITAGTYTTEHGGSLVVQTTGSYTYTPAGGYSGEDSALINFDIGTSHTLDTRFAFVSTGSVSTDVVPNDLVPHGDHVTVTARLSNGDPLPAWLSFNGVTFSGTPAAGDSGPLAIDIVATDDSGLVTIVPFAIKVGSTNAAPTAASLATVHATQDQPFELVVPDTTFSDSNTRDRLTITATLADGSPLPGWLAFDGMRFTGYPESADVASLSVRLTATDIFGATAQSTFALIVDDANDDPVAGAPIDNQMAQQGQAFDFAVPAGSFVDPDAGDTLTYSATLGDGSALPSWLSFSGGTFTGTPGVGDAGVFLVQIVATDSHGATATSSFAIGVFGTNVAPAATETLDPLEAPVNAFTTITLPSDLFEDLDDPSIKLSAERADGSALPNWIIFNPDDASITVVPDSSILLGAGPGAGHVDIRIVATDTRGAKGYAPLSIQAVVPPVDTTITATGSGYISGSSLSERFVTDGFDNTIFGANGVDRIAFGRNAGQDSFSFNLNRTTALGSIVEFDSDVLPGDVTFTRTDSFGQPNPNGEDLLITIAGSTASLRISGQYYGPPTREPQVREFQFANGTILSAADIVALQPVTPGPDVRVGGTQADTLIGGAGNDTLRGDGGDDVLIGGPGDDLLFGDRATPDLAQGGNDVFVFNLGDGHDRIVAQEWVDSLDKDTLRFGAGITPGDLILTRLPGVVDANTYSSDPKDAGSLLIQIAGTDDSVQIYKQFYTTPIYQQGTDSLGIDRFEFADGTVLTRNQLEARLTLTPATAGDDAIYGGGGADRLEGKGGNDLLVGEDGNDTYVYNAGDGNDTIRESYKIDIGNGFDSVAMAGNEVSNDTLVLGPGILPSDLIFTRPDAYGEDLVITFANQPGSITIEGQFRNIFHLPTNSNGTVVTSYFGTQNTAIDTIRFGDGTEWSTADIYAKSIQATAGDDVIDGFFKPNETLDGGAGNDLLVGRNGNDQYVFGRGYGHDTIKEFGWFKADLNTGFSGDKYTAADSIKFVGVSSSDVTTSIGTGGSFVFTINDTGETLTIKSESEFANFTSIIFSDTTWSAAQFQSHWTIAAATSGNDTINGFLSNDTISGGSGNDVLEGNQGTDALDGGDGNDTLILEADDSDSASGGNNDDNFKIVAAGRYTSTVNDQRGRLDFPGTVNFGQESGTIDGGAGNDTLELGGSIAKYWNGSSYLVSNGGSTYRIANLTVSNIETVKFADGTVSFATLLAATSELHPGVIEGTAGNDVMNGTSGNDDLLGLAGNDTLNGLGGDDFLAGGDGTDTYDGGSGFDVVDYAGETVAWSVNLATGQATGNAVTETIANVEGVFGGHAADTLTGSAVANLIRGNDGDDTIAAGDGDDTVEFGGSSAGFDAVDGGLGNDTIRATATGTQIGLRSVTGVETITANGFANVTISGSSAADTLNFASTSLIGITSLDGGAGNDVLTGSAGADLILAGSGDDTLAGSGGNDVFQVSGTSGGFDAIDGGSGTDVILATANNTRIGLTNLSGVETITANGFTGVFISGSSNADTINVSGVTLVGIGKIDGGSGADTITGTGNADVIIGNSGDDILAGGAGNDTFQMSGSGAGFDTIDGGADADIVVATANNTVIGLTAISNVETISSGGFTGVTISGSSTANTLDFSTINLTGIGKIDGGSGNDTITGTGNADILLGSAGDDALFGGGGNDNFQYTGSSNGFDAVDGGGGSDTLAALANNTVIGLSSITGVETISSGGFTGVSVAGSGNADTLNFSAVTLSGIAKIDGGAGNDTITGSAAADVILGSGGDDILNGGDGNDTVQYTGSANGFDAVDGGNGTDGIVALANSTVIGLSAITGIETISAGSFTGVTIAGSTGNDTLDFSAVTLTGITKIDGGAGNDTITGSAGSDTIVGNTGDDTLAGGNGNDTFSVTGTTNGFDSVDGGGGTDTISTGAANTVIGLSSLSGVETITGGSFAGVYIAGSGNDDTLNFQSVTLTAITRVEGGAGNDTITGNTAANTLWGGLGNDTLNGDAGNDTLVGDDGDDILIGGAGSDTLTGGNGIDTADYGTSTANLTISLAVTTAQTITTGESETLATIENLTGGSGNDTLTGSTATNVLKGGSGADRITGGAGNDSLDGGLGADVAVFAGTQATYSIVTSAGTTTIVDNATTTDGNDGTDTLVGIEKAEFKGGVQVGIAAPIILDLDGNGVRTIDQSQSTTGFDWDQDGRSDVTSWVGKGDGFLVYDRNGDGTVSGADELSFVNDKPGAKSDLDGLRAFDSNGDGQFSILDDKWASFSVWADGNSNGIFDDGEFKTLGALGIASISLAGQAVDRIWDWGQAITVNTGGFTLTDGTTRAFSDVALSYASGVSGDAAADPQPDLASAGADTGQSGSLRHPGIDSIWRWNGNDPSERMPIRSLFDDGDRDPFFADSSDGGLGRISSLGLLASGRAWAPHDGVSPYIPELVDAGAADATVADIGERYADIGRNAGALVDAISSFNPLVAGEAEDVGFEAKEKGDLWLFQHRQPVGPRQYTTLGV